LIISKVKPLIEKEEYVGYKNRMITSVELGSAFCIGDDCFLYFKKVNRSYSTMFSFYALGNPVKMMCLMWWYLSTVDTNIKKLDFIPHSVKSLKNFRSLLPLITIKRSIDPNYPVTIKCDYLRKKLLKIYSDRGIKWLKQ